MTWRLTVLLAAFVSLPLLGVAQDAAIPDPAVSAIAQSPASTVLDAAPDGTVPDADTPPVAQPTPSPLFGRTSPRTQGFYTDGWKDISLGVAKDEKRIWLFPVSPASRHHLKTTVAIVGVTAALIGVDKYVTGYFNRTDSFHGFNDTFSGPRTALVSELIPAGLYAVGLARRDKYAQQTFFLAGRAVIDAEILTSVMKDIDRRDIPENGNYSDTWFNKTTGHYLGGKGSFPSGHTIAAFAVATMYADRYPNPRWHKWVAYGLAGLIGFSRVSIHAHYGSDVFAAAALGYVIAHYAVFQPH